MGNTPLEQHVQADGDGGPPADATSAERTPIDGRVSARAPLAPRRTRARSALRWRSVVWCAATGLALLYALGTFVPWQPMPFGALLDASYPMGLNVAFGSGWRFGTDVVFTLGPYGFVYNRCLFPPTFGLVVAAWTFFTVAFWYGGLTIARRAFRSALAAGLWLAALTGVTSVLPEAFFASLGVLLIVTYFTDDDQPLPPSVLLLTMAVAWAALIKFTFLMNATIVVGAIALDEVARRRRLPLVPLVFVVALIVLWLAAGQRLADAGIFLSRSMEVAGGYSDAMSWSGPYGEALAAAGISILLLAFVARGMARVRGAWAVVPVGAFGAVLLLAFKTGFVRHDSHALTAASVLLVSALLTVAALRRASAVHAALGLLCVATAAGFLQVTLTRYVTFGLPRHIANTIRLLPERAAAAADVLAGRTDLKARYEANLAGIRLADPVPPATGRVDVYPWSIAVAVAHGLDYSPRPVIQSYAAYTASLAELNARHLRETRAPDSILFDIGLIDGRFPSLDDGRSWPELLTRYDLADAAGRFILLKRASVPRDYRLEPIATTNVRLGERVRVPSIDGGPIWASIEVRPTVVGRVASAVFRAPKVLMEVTTKQGAVLRYRIVPSLAEAGFLLSPLVDNTLLFTLLAGQGSLAEDAGGAILDANSITSLAVMPASGGTVFYRPEVRVSLARLRFPAQDVEQVPGLHPLASLGRLGSATVRAGNPVVVAGRPGGSPALFVPAPSSISLDVPAGAARLRVGFGMLDGSWREGGNTDGVEFRVVGVAAGRAETLWSRRLDPVLAPADRGPQSAAIDLSTRHADPVRLETRTGPTDSWDWSYWSEVLVERSGTTESLGPSQRVVPLATRDRE